MFQKPSSSIRSDLPILVLAGSDDPIGAAPSNEKLVNAYLRAGLDDVTMFIYEGARHEVYNETNKDEVFADLLAWLDAKL